MGVSLSAIAHPIRELRRHSPAPRIRAQARTGERGQPQIALATMRAPLRLQPERPIDCSCALRTLMRTIADTHSRQEQAGRAFHAVLPAVAGRSPLGNCTRSEEHTSELQSL